MKRIKTISLDESVFEYMRKDKSTNWSALISELLRREIIKKTNSDKPVNQIKIEYEALLFKLISLSLNHDISGILRNMANISDSDERIKMLENIFEQSEKHNSHEIDIPENEKIALLLAKDKYNRVN